MFGSLLDNQPITRAPRAEAKDCLENSNRVMVKESSKTYQDVFVVKQLNKAKFPVYLVCSKVNNQKYAMKTFTYENGKPNSYYLNEIRFANFHHDNVIRNFYFDHQRKTISENGMVSKMSLKIMEFAPYGDFFDLIMKYGRVMDDKLVRSYFKQLIEGLEYLHKNGVSHLDLKLENLLIGEDFTLKIADFDLSYIDGDTKILSKGTKFYRPPEISLNKCKDTKAADIYSAGILLFAFKTQGVLPHAEGNYVNGVNFSQLLHTNEAKFWKEHCKIQGRQESFFDNDFRELFVSMTHNDPEKRATIETIKRSKWYNGPCYTPEEIKNRMNRISWK